MARQRQMLGGASTEKKNQRKGKGKFNRNTYWPSRPFNAFTTNYGAKSKGKGKSKGKNKKGKGKQRRN